MTDPSTPYKFLTQKAFLVDGEPLVLRPEIRLNKALYFRKSVIYNLLMQGVDVFQPGDNMLLYFIDVCYSLVYTGTWLTARVKPAFIPRADTIKRILYTLEFPMTAHGVAPSASYDDMSSQLDSVNGVVDARLRYARYAVSHAIFGTEPTCYDLQAANGYFPDLDIWLGETNEHQKSVLLQEVDLVLTGVVRPDPRVEKFCALIESIGLGRTYSSASAMSLALFKGVM